MQWKETRVTTSPDKIEPDAWDEGQYPQWKGWTDFGNLDEGNSLRFATELSLVPVAAHSNVVEIGFGAGEFMAWCRSVGHHVVGFEVEPALVAAARLAGFEAHAISDLAEILQGLPKQDLICAFDVLEHLDLGMARSLLSTLLGALAPQGKILLQFPNASSPLVGHVQYGDLTHRTHLNRGSLEQLVQPLDLRVTAYRRPAVKAVPSPAATAIELFRKAIYRGLALLSRGLNGADVGWWPVAIAVVERCERPTAGPS
jgi:2-polyprenyl-3-methyl-5-hydroxy-6-metoxy-1,4-benzoquinol methylase